MAHEFIIDFRPFKQGSGVDAAQVAKRLMDYGFHAPTVSFPVANTMMIEPTESEDLAELDRFADAMIAIRHEIDQIEHGVHSQKDNPIANAPHTAYSLTADNWTHSYSRQVAAFPTKYQLDWKFWPPVGLIDNGHGDRHLICTCPPLESYESEPEPAEMSS